MFILDKRNAKHIPDHDEADTKIHFHVQHAKVFGKLQYTLQILTYSLKHFNSYFCKLEHAAKKESSTSGHKRIPGG